MSGHNKWTQIKRQKEKTDAQKSKLFGKLAKLIADEAKKAGGNRNSAGLRAAVERAKAENMPNENIERAIKKSTEASAALEAITYEAYGPGGAAIIIEVLTDNRNKAAQEVKAILARHGVSLASPGSASWAFMKSGMAWTPTASIPLSPGDSELLLKISEELEDNDDVQEVFTNAE